MGWSEWWEHGGAKTIGTEYVEGTVNLCRRMEAGGL